MTAEDRAFQKILTEQVQELCAQLSDIHHQLERIADHLEATEDNG